MAVIGWIAQLHMLIGTGDGCEMTLAMDTNRQKTSTYRDIHL